MQRPAGVVVIAVLYWLSAFTLLLMGIVMAVGFTAFGSVATGMMSMFAGFGVIGGIILIGFGAVLAFLGYSLFQLNEWARVTTIVLVALGENLAVLDDKQSGDALAREKIVNRVGLLFEAILEFRFGGGLG